MRLASSFILGSKDVSAILIHALDSVVNLPSLSDIPLALFHGYAFEGFPVLAFLDILNLCEQCRPLKVVAVCYFPFTVSL